MEKLRIQKPILVEGRYDKCKLASVLDAHIIPTDGFGVFRSEQKKELIRRLAKQAGRILVLTDSDGAGLVIRNYINSILPKELVIHLYTPQIPGKERRKNAPSKEGLLGVEGMDADLLRRLFEPYADGRTAVSRLSLTKADLYRDGLSGRADSAARRRALAQSAGLPENLSANALMEALNLLYDAEGYAALLAGIADAEDKA